MLIYLAYTCIGLAIGRKDLSSPQFTRKLLTGSAAIIAVSWISWLALPASRSHGWVYLIRSINNLGSAILLVVFALLLARTPMMDRLLRPFAAAGTMTLTLYSGYALLLTTGVSKSNPGRAVRGAAHRCVAIRRDVATAPGRRPLEWLVAQLSRRARQAVREARTKQPE